MRRSVRLIPQSIVHKQLERGELKQWGAMDGGDVQL